MDLFPPTEQQLDVIRHRGSNLLIFAGPGTGKTETLARRFASLVADDGVRPNEILVLTFSRRAADEMRDRVLLRLRQRLGSGLAVSELFVKTFHGFCGRLLDGEGRHTRLGLLTPVKERLLWRRVMRSGKVSLQSFSPDVVESAQFATDCLNVIAQLKGRGIDVHTLQRIAADDIRLRDIANIFGAMEQARRELQLRDFRDLVIEAVLELGDPNGSAAAWLRGANFRHILVDEFQDSDLIDLQLLQKIAHIATPAPAFCFVGDVNQSIYRFRGASPGNVESARELFHCDTLPLQNNRRSAQAILDIANADAQLQEASLTQAADQAKPGWVTLVRPRTVDDEVRDVCAAIAAQLTSGVAPRDIAVLLRQGYPHRELISAALRTAGIPVAALPAAGFHEDGLVDAALTALRLFAAPLDEALWRRLLVNPIVGYRSIDVRNAFDVARRSGKASPEAALRATPPYGPRTIAEFLRSWERCEDAYRAGNPLNVLQRVVAELDLLRPVREPLPVPGFDPIASPLRLQALLTAAKDYAETEVGTEMSGGAETSAHDHSTVAEFIARLEETVGLLADALEPPANAVEGVRVMSIHAAKGLEFDFVAIPQLIDGILPAGERPNRLLGARSVEKLRRAGVDIFAESSAAMQEEHSLWYVALTRAKSHVLASAPQFDDDGIELQLSPFAAPILARAPAVAAGGVRRTSVEPTVVLGVKAARNGPQSKAAGEQIALELDGKAADSTGIRLDLLALSPTRINDFLICPRRFYYAHVLKLERDDEEVTQHGKLLHAVLKRFHEIERDFERVSDADESAKRYFASLSVLIRDEVRAAGQGQPEDSPLAQFEIQNLESRLRMYAQQLAEEAEAQPFTVLATEEYVTAELDGVQVRGQVDRIDRLAGGGLVIRDYKSGRRKADLAFALRKAFAQMDAGEDIFGDAPTGLNFQTMLYVGGVEHKFGEPVARLDFLYFRGKGGSDNGLLIDHTMVTDDDAPGEHCVSRADIARVERDVVLHIRDLCNAGGAMAFATAKRDDVCVFCDFTRICPGVGAVLR
ncbi:MAG: ATP-dependent helicase [Candidatus Eremiobacteraeota bacterium]|nr:ATP-dependent helicase [Candidatus Eremiobacteraeota bacterium]